ncbi:hypothetical protein [Thermus amyloliquefaciens]|uniref:hypothetical protein n=1 Tax=Thermus amyloliquefaciens TaxID=1449080 RepID=UPI00068DECB0|nr:hypothetical protein [Thermus amyloliquefaciens]
MDPGLRKRVLAWLREAKALWQSLPPELRRQILLGLVALLPWGRLGRAGPLLKRMAGPGGQLALALWLRLLKR